MPERPNMWYVFGKRIGGLWREWTPIILPMVRGCHISPPSPPPCYLSWWQGGGVELAEGSPSSWICWFHGASLIWHLHAVASGQRVIDNYMDIHLELSMTRLTSDPFFKRNIIYLIIIAIMMHLIIITIMMHWIIITIMMYHHNFPLFTCSLFTFHLSPP